jgi:hypothetical protein
MLIVEDILHVNTTAKTSYEVKGDLVRVSTHPALTTSMPLPVYLVWADSPEEALMAYKARLNEIVIENIKQHFGRDEIRIAAFATEVGDTAPYDFGDYCEVLVMGDDLTERWTRCVVYGAKKHSTGTRWEIEVVQGWAGTNGFRTRVWANDEGIGDIVRPLAEAEQPSIPRQEVIFA